MAKHHAHNLNTHFKLNTRLIYDKYEKHGLDNHWLAEKLGCHKQTVQNFLAKERIPALYIFEKIPGVLGVPREALLMPLKGEVGNG